MMYCYCFPTFIRLLRRHLPRRGRQSAAAVDGCSAGIAWKASPKGDAQSAETFRVVGMDATDS